MFLPGSIKPSVLDADMRRALADSLRYLLDETGCDLGIVSADAIKAIDAIVEHRIRPGVFGRYYQLVPAIERGDRPDSARLFRAIINLAKDEPSFTVAPFLEQRLGDDASLYGALVAPVPGGGHWLAAPLEDAWTGFEQKVGEALATLEQVDPFLALELRALLVQVVGASPADGRSFGGASSFMLWGLVLLNVETYSRIPLLIEGLVHEAAHQLLFALSINEPLVTNPLAERYSSPLRRDDRPMDGIFHATFVTARLHYLYRKLSDATDAGLCLAPASELDGKLSTYRDLYFAGLETIEKHGRLTATGQQVLEESLQYMRAA
ncbi:hypothetical protein JQ554_23700 [Bradyrhizobium diazoefficiens]|nr:HEXXH motif-containing putative peptide modification protein [Bradyrhizobium diazoefficiens]MBR0967059.1 hypothetical protein [Bradyrhizobium diazoefficiens]MBR0979183.1 hypothetical protein [Bradyrhizobium diazoefficiens]MBR1016620.1 hypothetical protein [Bradyrhizobium diazoefficiens]MBR1053880.1 hypothetical protein [Bradyrhizobium diazoefficiens]MBR1060458.1 hypothetical protein [Bradyrhizobium diazoefficiens]